MVEPGQFKLDLHFDVCAIDAVVGDLKMCTVSKHGSPRGMGDRGESISRKQMYSGFFILVCTSILLLIFEIEDERQVINFNKNWRT